MGASDVGLDLSWHSVELGGPLRRAIDAWAATIGARPVVIASHGNPEVGVAPISGAMWQKLSRMFRIDFVGPEPVDLIIRIRGGNLAYLRDLLEAIWEDDRIVRRAVVLDWAMSAGTLLALSCGQVVLGRGSYVGPVSPQIAMLPGNFPSATAETIELLGRYPALVSRSPDELRAFTVSMQWRQEIERWIGLAGQANGWKPATSAKISSTLLDWKRPHDSHLYHRELSEIPDVFQSASATEDAALADLRDLLDVDLLQPTPHGVLAHSIVFGDQLHRLYVPAFDRDAAPETVGKP